MTLHRDLVLNQGASYTLDVPAPADVDLGEATSVLVVRDGWDGDCVLMLTLGPSSDAEMLHVDLPGALTDTIALKWEVGVYRYQIHTTYGGRNYRLQEGELRLQRRVNA